MSFYGNTYYYTAEAFARIILKNSNLITFNGPPTEEENPNFFPAGPIELDAVKRQCGLGLENGNYWIGLETDQSIPAIRIWHNNPCKKGTIFATRGFEKSAPPMALTPDRYTQLDFDDFIKVPVIQYDKLGHIIPPDPSEEFEDVSFFRLPLNPTEELKGRMNAIDGVDNNYENSLKAKLEKQMEENLSEIKDIKAELDEKVKEFNQALPTVESSAIKIAQAEKDILLLETAASGLAANVKDLQGQITLLQESVKKLQEKI